MPETEVLIFAEDDGSAPLLVWLDALPPKVRVKCDVRTDLLRNMGHDLRRPLADFLRDGIHELRVGFQGISYRVLYFFNKQRAVISHGLIKEKEVPEKEIDLAVDRKRRFEADPEKHTYGV